MDREQTALRLQVVLGPVRFLVRFRIGLTATVAAVALESIAMLPESLAVETAIVARQGDSP